MASNFYNSHGFPQFIGAADGTHVGIKRSSLNVSDFINRKGKYKLNIRVATDYKYRFFDVVIKWPGSVLDARTFSNSKLNTMFTESVVPDRSKIMVEGEPLVPICILGEPAYPLLSFIIKEFASSGKNEGEQFFGYRLLSARIVIEYAFGRLKARFGCFRRCVDIDLDDLTGITHSCFILHNFREIHKETINLKYVTAALKFGIFSNVNLQRKVGIR